MSSTTQTITLRKRKRQDSLVIHLSSPAPSCENEVAHTESEYDPGQTSDFSNRATQALVPRQKRYVCSFDGCVKAYTKPSRLAEHERAHTGHRPYVCSTCNKSYLREHHLQAHSRTHLPSSSKPFTCEEQGCGKKFWTSQHLRVHTELHKGEKPFKCTEPQCDASFSKNHQLRDHICKTHSPPGTKSYRCAHHGCKKSFSTNQKLTAHANTHNEKRYTCVHQSCLPAEGAEPTYHPTWSALQHHTRTAHPPMCPYPSCQRKTFTQQKGLRAHMKIHAQRDQEADIDGAAAAEADDAQLPRKRRRGGELGRDWRCDVDGCGKDFKSKKALSTHHHIAHLGRRDFICPHGHCQRAFGYKHLLQRHLAKLHAPAPIRSPSDSDSDSGNDDDDDDELTDDADAAHESPSPVDPASNDTFDIDFLTGNAYALHAKESLQQAHKLQCPHPHLPPILLAGDVEQDGSNAAASGSKRINDCQYVFSRAYDLRRHLRAEHGVAVERDKVDRWVRDSKTARALG